MSPADRTLIFYAILAALLAWWQWLRHRERIEGHRRPDEPQPPAPHPHLGQLVVLNTEKPDDQSLRGILTQAGRWYVITAPSIAVPEGSTVRWDPLPGDVTIEADHVAWLQAAPMPATGPQATTVPAEPK